MKWHFITFASGEGFKRSGYRLLREAEDSKLFQSSRLFDESDLAKDEVFWAECGAFFQDSRHKQGYGFWLWKPKIILNAIKRIPLGDGVLYMDAGSHLNLNSKASWDKMSTYFEFARLHNSLAFEVGEQAKEVLFTHPQIFRDMDVPTQHQYSPQIEAGSLFLINTIENQTFLRNWLHWMTRNNFKYLLNQNFSLHNTAYFGRYDQSIMSCLYKIGNMAHLPNETYFHPHWSKHGKAFPIWHIRNRGGGRVMKTWISIQIEIFLKRLLSFVKSRFNTL